MIKIRSFGMSDIGMVRAQNQDSFAVDEEFGIYIVADGMGGMENGGDASQFVTKNVKDRIKEEFKKTENKNVRFIIRTIRKIVNEVNRNLKYKISKKSGTTLILIIVYNGKAFITNVGDSLAYLYSNNEFVQLTPEHNLAWVLVMMNKIDAIEAKTHPARHRLTAFMGMDGDIPAYVNVVRLKPKDKILMCTDGLTGMIPEENIKRVLDREDDIYEVVLTLIEKANNAGGEDNITTLLLEAYE